MNPFGQEMQRVLAIAVVTFCLQYAATGQTTDSRPPIVWTCLLGRDSNMCAEVAMTTLLSNDQLMVAARLTPPATPQETSSLLLWVVNREGAKVREVEVALSMKGKPVAEPFIRLLGIAPTQGGGAIVLGRSITESTWIIEVDREGRALHVRDLDLRMPRFLMYKIVRLPHEKYLLLGSRGDDACVIKMDHLGNVEWNKTFDLGHIEAFETAIPLHDGGIVLVGDSTEKAGILSMGPSKIWVVRCDDDGNVVAQQVFSGRYGTGCRGVRGGFAIVYDRKEDASQEVWLQFLNESLALGSSAKLFAAAKNISLFRVVPMAGGGFLIAGSEIPWLWMSAVSAEGTDIWTFKGSPQEPLMKCFDALSSEAGTYVCASSFSIDDRKRATTKVAVVRIRNDAIPSKKIMPEQGKR
jgi:hypothetical protein